MRPPDRAPIATGSSTDRQPIVPALSRVRSRTTNSPADRLGRTAQARRVKDLYAGYLDALGNPADVPTLALVLAAAEAVAIAEVARAAYLDGKGDLNAVVRAENTANRSLKRIGLAKPSATAKPKKTFAERMADADAARRAAEAAAEPSSTLTGAPP
ncbi:hypothetical protein AAFG13_06080 [Bradyrhizobium sp. B124]|uniref:hypothetical protein n=1 Tax=Bradyrhizobium sp. B124 TaxID=3140245 RepID=UPI0031837F9C